VGAVWEGLGGWDGTEVDGNACRMARDDPYCTSPLGAAVILGSRRPFPAGGSDRPLRDLCPLDGTRARLEVVSEPRRPATLRSGCNPRRPTVIG
jgi:hypothetical protein